MRERDGQCDGPNTQTRHREIICLKMKRTKQQSLAVFTLEDEQIVWKDKSSRTNKLSDVKMGRTNRLIFGGLELKTIFFPYDLSVETNKSTTVQHKFTSDGQMSDDLFVL